MKIKFDLLFFIWGIYSALIIALWFWNAFPASAYSSCKKIFPTPIPESVVTPSPIQLTPTITPILSNNSTPEVNTTPWQAPHAVCNIPFSGPVNPVFKRESSTSVNFSWWPSTAKNIEIQAINYGYSPMGLIYGVILPANSGNYSINYLSPGNSVYAQICSYMNGCAQCTSIIDP